jgi:FkbM family methyltransferase
MATFALGPMPSARTLLDVLRYARIPRSAGLDLVRLEAMHRLRPRAVYDLRLGGMTLHLTEEDYEIDWKSFAWVFLDDSYAGDYTGAVVLDLGAHKGYAAAYAFSFGARMVISYEPEAANFELLERSARSSRARGRDWRTRRAAITAQGGEAELHVMGASWGHALHPPAKFARYEVGVQRVPVEAVPDVLERAHALAGGAPLIVKINIEGEECPTILGTPATAWEGVDELFVETHPWAECGADELERHLSPAGLVRRESTHHLMLVLHRPRPPRSGPRTAPS